MKPLALLLAAIWLVRADAADFELRKAEVRTLLERFDFSAALEQAEAINRQWPDDVATYQLIAASRLGLGDYTEAEVAAQWMLDLRLGKADAAGWLVVAHLREVTGDFDGAMDVVNTAYRDLRAGQDRERIELLTRSGRLLWLTGKLDAAEQVLRDALAKAPDDADALEAMARVKTARGRPGEAIEILRGIARSTGRAKYLYQIAVLGGEPAAYEVFAQAAGKQSASTGNANRELALYYAGPGKRPIEALAIARREAARRHDVWTLDALAVALEANGKMEEARATMERVLAAGTRYPEILRHAEGIGLAAR